MLKPEAKQSIINIILVLVLILPTIMYVDNWLNTPETIVVHASSLPTPSPLPTDPVGQNTNPEAEEDVVPTPKVEGHTKKHIDYLKQIFGDEWKIAYAVAQNECNSSRSEWPKCVNSNSKEYSIGWFQINLAQENGEGAWIHASKVPGETIEEKREWLENPFNNILMAKIIRDRSGWEAWSAYTSNNYLNDL